MGISSEAKKLLEQKKLQVRVVSMPCMELFENQHDGYKNLILPPEVRARVTVEAGSSLGWEKYAGDIGNILSMTTFGLSGNADTLYEHFGFTPENVKKAALDAIKTE